MASAISSGFREDCSEFLSDFAKLKATDYHTFCQEWKRTNFQYIFFGRNTDAEMAEYLGEIFYTVKKMFIASKNQFERIGSFYLLYTLYFKQPLFMFCKIRLTLMEWRVMKDFARHPYNGQELPQITVILWKMFKSDAFRFVQDELERGFDRFYYKSSGTGYDSSSSFRTNRDLERELQTLTAPGGLMNAMEILEMGYNEMKEAMDARAYCKVMLHAAKYPHLAVNGLLLAENGKPSTIVDAVPLFHQCLHVSPMAEVALVQVEAKASQKGQQIVGYYVGCENFYDNRFERAPGIRIADKIAEHCSEACIAVIDNRSISINMRYPALRMWQYRDNRWSKTKCAVENDRVTFDAVSCLLQRDNGASTSAAIVEDKIPQSTLMRNLRQDIDLFKHMLQNSDSQASSRIDANMVEDDSNSVGAKRYSLRRKAFKREVKKKIFRIAGKDSPQSSEESDEPDSPSTPEKSTTTAQEDDSKGSGIRNIRQSMLKLR
uniref:MPN domain-containing protein n=1 Tax=Anopheles christyi TaxID=43041 RepID=A0A182JZC6_9DIPT